MQVLTISELMAMTPIDLCTAMARIAAVLREFREGSIEHLNAQMTLRNIRSVLARRNFSP